MDNTLMPSPPPSARAFRLRYIHSDDISPPILTPTLPPSFRSSHLRSRRMRNQSRRQPTPLPAYPPETPFTYGVQIPLTLPPPYNPSVNGTNQTLPNSPPPPYSLIPPNPQPADSILTTTRQALSILSRPLVSRPSPWTILQLFTFTVVFQVMLFLALPKLAYRKITRTLFNFGAWIHIIPPLLTLFATLFLSNLIIRHYLIISAETTPNPLS